MESFAREIESRYNLKIGDRPKYVGPIRLYSYGCSVWCSEKDGVFTTILGFNPESGKVIVSAEFATTREVEPRHLKIRKADQYNPNESRRGRVTSRKGLEQLLRSKFGEVLAQDLLDDISPFLSSPAMIPEMPEGDYEGQEVENYKKDMGI